LGGSEKKEANVKDNPDDIPMAYLLYVLLTIVGMLVVAIIVVAKVL
jgi:hypothetical protein